jgi:hypothetical protein
MKVSAIVKPKKLIYTALGATIFTIRRVGNLWYWYVDILFARNA